MIFGLRPVTPPSPLAASLSGSISAGQGVSSPSKGGLRSSPFFQRGIIQDAPVLNQWLAHEVSQPVGGGYTLRRPTWQVGRSHEETAVYVERSNNWGGPGLSPVTPVAEQVIADYWGRQLHKMIRATILGIVAGNNTAPSRLGTHAWNDLLYDVANYCGGAYVPAQTAASVAYVNRTLSLIGNGVQHGITDVVMHSKVFDPLLYGGEIDVRPGVGQFLENLFVTVDDGVGNPSPGVFDTYFFGPGFLEFGEATHPQSRWRTGPDLWDLVHWCVHPMGHRFDVASIRPGGPTNLELAHPDSWRRTATLREHIPFACLRTREF